MSPRVHWRPRADGSGQEEGTGKAAALLGGAHSLQRLSWGGARAGQGLGRCLGSRRSWSEETRVLQALQDRARSRHGWLRLWKGGPGPCSERGRPGQLSALSSAFAPHLQVLNFKYEFVNGRQEPGWRGRGRAVGVSRAPRSAGSRPWPNPLCGSLMRRSLDLPRCHLLPAEGLRNKCPKWGTLGSLLCSPQTPLAQARGLSHAAAQILVFSYLSPEAAGSGSRGARPADQSTARPWGCVQAPAKANAVQPDVPGPLGASGSGSVLRLLGNGSWAKGGRGPCAP